MKNEMLKQQNLLFELHESEFIGFTIKDSDLIFRVAINCGVEEKLCVESEFAEKFYIYDVICHKYEMIESNYAENSDLLLKDILCFKIVEDKYLLSININFSESVDFIFDCDSIEWLPIKLVTSDELDTIK